MSDDQEKAEHPAVQVVREAQELMRGFEKFNEIFPHDEAADDALAELSRKYAPKGVRRRLIPRRLNEDSIVKALQKRGVRIVRPSNGPMADFFITMPNIRENA